MTLFHHLRVSRNRPQSPNDLLISLHESTDDILDANLIAKLPDEGLNLAQPMSRDTREQMMYRLEL
jgi:hypothetical protein